MSFYENGGWNGEVTALKWRGIDTTNAWALGKHSKKNAEEACSAREGSDRKHCIEELISASPIEVFATCSDGVAWRNGQKERYRLTDKAKAGGLNLAEDDAAWSTELTHRAKFTVASWFALLCPSNAKRWGLGG
jgi:hypothetical protein